MEQTPKEICTPIDIPREILSRPDGRFVPTGKQLEISVSGQEGTEVYTGYGPSQFRGVNIPFVLIRRNTNNTVFRAVIKIPA